MPKAWPTGVCGRSENNHRTKIQWAQLQAYTGKMAHGLEETERLVLEVIKAAGGTTKELEELPRANSGRVALRKLFGKGPWRLADRWRRDWKFGAPRTSVRR